MSLYDSLLRGSLGSVPQSESPYARLKRQALEGAQPEPSQEQMDSLLRQAGGAIVGGASYIGGSLDKGLGARAIRGALGGNAREVLSLIPFSDTLGITDPSQAVGGRDLLEKSGLLAKNKPGFDLGDLAGFAAEVALDPATYLTLGASALTKTGKAAKLAGVLPKARADRIAQGLGGLARIKVPLLPEAVLGTGATAQKIAGGMDKLGDAVRWSKAGRITNAIFNQDVRDAIGKPGQQAAMQATDATVAGQAAVRGSAVEQLRALQAANMMDDASASTLKRMVEGVEPMQGPLGPIAQKLRQQNVDMLGHENDAWLATQELVDPAGDYSARYGSNLDKPTKGFSKSRLLGTSHASMKHRDEIFTGITGMTEGLRDMVRTYGPQLDLKSPTFAQNKAQATTDVLNKYLGGNPAQLPQAESLVDWISTLDPKHHATGYFGNHVLTDHVTRQAMSVDRVSNAHAIKDLFAGNASLGRQAADDVPLSKALDNAGLKPPDEATVLGFLNNKGVAAQKLDDVFVPREVAEDAARVIQGLTVPDALKPVTETYDWLTQAFKTGVTTPFPGFHVRNLGTTVWQNFVIGALNPMAYKRAYGIVKGKSVSGLSDIPLFKGMNDKQAQQALVDLAYQHRAVDPQYANDLASAGGNQLDDMLKQIPGESPDSASSALGAAVGNLKGRPKPIEAGRRLGAMTETVGRLSGFEQLLRKGYSPAVAAEKIRAAHVDYRALSSVEKQIFKRVVPFYSFTRRSLPFALSELAQKPGGKVAQAVRFQNSMRDGEGFTPDYIGGGLAIPLGGEQGGFQRYLTQLDLPHEGLNDLLQLGAGGMKKTGASILGQLNPLIKGPGELLTGQQFFSGRELRDLDPRTGRLLHQMGVLEDPRSSKLVNALDQVVMNSPLSRVVSTVGQIADTRKSAGDKAWNLLTGVRISQVDMDKQREIESRKTLENLLRGRPGVSVHESLYIPKGEREKVNPQTGALMDALQGIHKRAQQERRKREKAQ